MKNKEKTSLFLWFPFTVGRAILCGGQINAETQQTVDALYHYKVKPLSASIAQAPLNGLVERGAQQK